MRDTFMKYAILVLTLATLGSGLLAQDPDIDVQYPVGSSLANGQTIDLGGSDNGTVHTLEFTIVNAGTADLVLTTPQPITGGSATNVNWVTNPPPISTIAPAGDTTFEVELTPTDDSEWDVIISVASNDPDEDPFNIRIRGVQGEPPEDDDDDCSTGEGGGTSVLMLAALLCGLVVALRLKGARA